MAGTLQGHGLRGAITSIRQSRREQRRRCLPKAEYEWWYQFYFRDGNAARLGYERKSARDRPSIWKNASPKWRFDDATFDRSAQSFDNPDHVAIVIHNYRWRLAFGRRRDIVRRARGAPCARAGHHRAHDHDEGDANPGRRTRTARPTRRSSRASTSIASSREASVTICRRKRLPPLPRLSSTSLRERPEEVRIDQRCLGCAAEEGAPRVFRMTSNEILFTHRCWRVCHHWRAGGRPAGTWTR